MKPNYPRLVSLFAGVALCLLLDQCSFLRKTQSNSNGDTKRSTVQNNPKQLEITKDETLSYYPDMRNLSISSRGEVIVPDEDPALKKTFADTAFLNSKYPSIIIPEDANRIITFGNNEGRAFYFYANLKIFDKSGNLIKLIDTISFDPTTIISDNYGSIYAIYATSGNKTLAKFDQNGNILWNNIIGAYSSFHLKVSKNGNYILLTYSNPTENTTIYNQNGNIISKINKCLSDAEFLDDKRLIAADYGSSWFVYDFTNNFKIIKYSPISYPLPGQFSFTIDDNLKYVVVLSYRGNDTHLLLYDYNTLNLIGEKYFNYKSYALPYNPVWKIEDNKITLKYTDKLIELEIR